jgi:hypothetical protein
MLFLIQCPADAFAPLPPPRRAMFTTAFNKNIISLYKDTRARAPGYLRVFPFLSLCAPP